MRFRAVRFVEAGEKQNSEARQLLQNPLRAVIDWGRVTYYTQTKKQPHVKPFQEVRTLAIR